MPLKAKKPEIKAAPRVKFMISGKSSAGKTYFALDFPKPYFIDTEGGAEREQYQEKLKNVDGMYFGKEQGSQDFNTVIEELKELATQKHDYKTLVIDSFSSLYISAMSIAEEKYGNEFSRDKKAANRPSRQLVRWINDLDMNVILICHQKDKWEKKADGKTEYGGTTFDGYDKLEYELDLWIEIARAGKGRIFTVKKSRILAFPEGETMSLDFKKFADLYGYDIVNKDSAPVILATTDQLDKIAKLTSNLNIPKEQTDKWMDKCKVESWEEMLSTDIQKIIDVLELKLRELVGVSAKAEVTQ